MSNWPKKHAKTHTNTIIYISSFRMNESRMNSTQKRCNQFEVINGLSCNQLNGRQSNPPTNIANFSLFTHFVSATMNKNNKHNNMRNGLAFESWFSILALGSLSCWFNNSAINVKRRRRRKRSEQRTNHNKWRRFQQKLIQKRRCTAGTVETFFFLHTAMNVRDEINEAKIGVSNFHFYTIFYPLKIGLIHCMMKKKKCRNVWQS